MDQIDGGKQGGGPGQPVERFVLSPHRSLSAKGFVILMGLFGAVCFLTGLAFLWVGAWPIMGFMGLDVLLLYIAFRVNYRAGQLSETVEISRDIFRLTRKLPSGRREAFELNPYWAQVSLATGADGHTALSVGTHGNAVHIGAFLTDDERRDLATALRQALQRLKAPPQNP
jgi:uncharacterized membrane protein